MINNANTNALPTASDLAFADVTLLMDTMLEDIASLKFLNMTMNSAVSVLKTSMDLFKDE